MPTARRALVAAGLFAVVVAASTPAFAAPGSHGQERAHGQAVRPAMVIPSPEHEHSHKRAEAHPAHPAHAGRTAHGARATTVRAASTATGSSGRVRGHAHKSREAHKTRAGHLTASADSAVTAAETANHGKHLAKGAKNGAQPARTTPGTAKAHPGKGAGRTTTKPGATKPAKLAGTPASRAAFGDTVPLASGRAAVAPRATARPHAHRTPKLGSHNGSGTPHAGSPNRVSPFDPRGALGDVGRQITNLTGIGLFGGPQGWIFTAMLLLAVVMMIGAFALGRRPRSAR
ncbi:MAG TPA: hypothetical protein VGN18_18230 [Jatrophihabitans sp.]|uniref:hypothetical protein n=1 Tax=Jatrophihabitans sp. TaxID=1932789 RepID=UPI002E06906A|nr:hypothetical protein [Jatrophihabitans sp.]